MALFHPKYQNIFISKIHFSEICWEKEMNDDGVG
jgi:hypothetical protein